MIQADVNDGFAYYNALNVNLNHRFSRRLQMLASYTWSHALDNVDPDIPSQNPNDPNFTGRQELGPAIYDERQRFVLSGVYVAPLGINFGGVGTLGTGLLTTWSRERPTAGIPAQPQTGPLSTAL